MSVHVLTGDDVTEKTIGSLIFLFAHREVTQGGIGTVAAATMPDLLRFVEENRIEVTGPCQFHYRHDTSRALLVIHMGLPVKQRPKTTGPFQVAPLEPWPCIANVHRGSMRRIDEAWGALETYARRRGLRRALTREVFVKWIEFDSEDNVTELQFGL
jgi:hypothetical protein